MADQTVEPIQQQLEEFTISTTREVISATYNLDAFRNQNLIRSAKFAARFLNIPEFVSDNREDLRRMIYLCDSVEFPGQTLTAVDYRIPGKLKVKIPYLRELNEVNFTFYMSENMPMYTVLSHWITEISPNTAQNSYFDEIVGTIELLQFQDTTALQSASSPNALKHMVVKLIDVYPLSIQSMPANWADDGFHKLNVSFYFRDLSISASK
jgi:hypothetical protein